VAEKIVAAIEAWPTGPTPEALALEPLHQIGAPARVVIEAALHGPQVARRDLLERAVCRIDAS
jgi:hypothetical protein